jgi:hypothetical protein
MSLSYWLKGGLFGLIAPALFVLYFIYFAVSSPYPMEAGAYWLYTFLAIAVISIILGIVIGWIVGKIKSK